jgi:hypothetical protein
MKIYTPSTQMPQRGESGSLKNAMGLIPASRRRNPRGGEPALYINTYITQAETSSCHNKYKKKQMQRNSSFLPSYR